MTIRPAALFVILILLVSACSSAPLQQVADTPTAVLLAAPVLPVNSDIRNALETILRQEVEAKNSANWATFQSLVHPNVSSRWLQQQRNLLDPTLADISITRIERNGEWALAVVIETYQGEDSRPSQVYTTRTFRQLSSGAWKLTSPNIESWGDRQQLQRDGLQLEYYTFDEPYVQAIAPRISLTLKQIAKDFGMASADHAAFHVRVTPFVEEAPSAYDSMAVTVPSPLSPGFPLGISQSPEEFLLGYLADSLGLALIKQTYGETATEPGRLALAGTAIQWEVEQALQRDRTSRFVAQSSEAATPLADLLDPTNTDVTGSRPAEQHLFLRFAIATYGSGILAPFLQAVYESDTAEDLAESAFHTELPTLEAQWRDWLAIQVAADRSY